MSFEEPTQGQETLTFSLQLSPTSGLILLIQESLKYVPSLPYSHREVEVSQKAVFHTAEGCGIKTNIHFLEGLSHDDAAGQVFYRLTWSVYAKRLDLNQTPWEEGQP